VISERLLVPAQTVGVESFEEKLGEARAIRTRYHMAFVNPSERMPCLSFKGLLQHGNADINSWQVD
jgi:hypothetical protein